MNTLVKIVIMVAAIAICAIDLVAVVLKDKTEWNRAGLILSGLGIIASAATILFA